VINTVSQRPEAIAAAAWRTWIMNERPPTAVPSTHFRGHAETKGIITSVRESVSGTYVL
jgi:hypothetical protein